MLKKLLSPAQCAECRLCCGFVDSDKWEIPLLAGEMERSCAERFGATREIPGTDSAVYRMEFHGDDIIMCPAAGEHGCMLGENRPFDCRIWPFRVMELNGSRVVTLSPVCPASLKMTVGEVSEFVNSGFADMLFEHARKFPETVKPYIDGYPIFAYEK